MKKSLLYLFAFAVGASLGSAVTWHYTKKKYEKIAEEEIKSVKEVFSKKEMWDMDLNTIDGLCDKVSGYLYSILTNGVRKTMEEVVK